MEIQQLKGFLALARTGSFTKAAYNTFVTQTAVSHQIKKLEQELNTKLFDRLGRNKVVLTLDGKILLDLISPLLEDIDTLSSRFNESRGNIQKGSVRIATHGSVMVYLLPDVIKAFKKKFPECSLSILNRGRNEIVDLLNNGEIDMGITSLQSVPKTIDYKVFARFNRILIASKNNPLAKKSTIRLEDITSYPILIPPKGTNTRTIIDRVFDNKKLKYTTAMEIVGREAVKIYAEMDLGIAIINEYYLTKDDKRNLFVKDVSNYFGQSERGILTRKGKYFSAAAKEFINITLQRFKINL